jgi:phage terminase large subunit GpA-like protein
MAPPPNLKVSEWSDENRVLSRQNSAEPGKWRTDRTPYLRDIMDAWNDPKVRRIVFMKPSQVGATEALLNILAYIMVMQACTTIVMQPTVKMAERWSKSRLAPMVRDTPALRGIFIKSPDVSNTVREKTFTDGQLFIIGANSPAEAASQPAPFLLCDEIDRYPQSAGDEGSPIELATVRGNSFWNAKQFLNSTPTDEDSQINAEFEASDQCFRFVPCPHCDHMQVLRWENLHWPKGEPKKARYCCESCGAYIEERQKRAMVAKGEFIATKPFDGVRGYFINELYSTVSTWAKMAQKFLAAKDKPEKLKVFINTSLAQVWKATGERTDPEMLANRRETYAAELPMGVVFLTAGVDVQDDRLEVEVKGWGLNEECWGICYEVYPGDTSQAEVWTNLEHLLRRRFEHESGIQLTISATAIDSGSGKHSKQVYAFCRVRQNCYAIKGAGGFDKPMVPKHASRTKNRNQVWILGVDSIKDLIMSRVANETIPGRHHWPAEYDNEYFEQLCAEKLTSQVNDWVTEKGWIKVRERNEALDCNVYAIAALMICNAALEEWAKRIPQQPVPKDSQTVQHQVLANPPHQYQRRVRSKGIEI